MILKGWTVDLGSCSTYAAPRCCASCLGPQEVEVKAQTSQKSGNIRTTLTMSFPYCQICAKRAVLEKLRRAVILVIAGLLGAGLPAGAWFLDVPVPAWARIVAAIALTAPIALLLALATRPSKPNAPATARGEAVALLNTHGSVLCTNPQFAWLLAQANGRQPREGTLWFTTEVLSPLTAGVMGVLLLVCWAKYGDAIPPSSPPPRAPAAAITVPSPPPRMTATATQPSPTVRRPGPTTGKGTTSPSWGR